MQEHVPSIVPRAGSSTSDGSSSTTSAACGPNDTTGSCQRGGSGGSNTMPIVVGTVVPLAIAIIVMIFLHRRHVMKLRREDAEDKHGSLDFGMGEGRRPIPASKSRRWKKQPPPPPPEMTMADAKMALRHDRGLSVDLGNNPYLLPPGLQHSRESLHSMSRSQNLGDDKYQRTDFIPDDGSIRSPTIRRKGDDSSSFSGSTRFRNDAESSRSLIHNAPLPVQPPKSYSPLPVDRSAAPSPANLLAPAAGDTRESMISNNGNTAAFRASNNYLGSFIRGGHQKKAEKELPKPRVSQVRVTEAEVVPTPEKEHAFVASPLPAIVMDEEPLEHARLSDYARENRPPRPPIAQEPGQRPARTTSMPLDQEPQIPQLSMPDFDSQGTTPKDSRQTSEYGQDRQEQSRATPGYEQQQQVLREPSYNQGQGQHREQHRQDSTTLPMDYSQYDQDDYYDPEDTYSVYDGYDEYYAQDQRKSMIGMRPLPPDDPSENPEQRANRIRSFYKEYFDETSKPGGGNVAQYYDGSENYYDDYYDPREEYYPPRGMSAAGGRNRAMSNGSYMSYGYSPGARAYSSASGRYNHPPRRPPPKKRQAPPKALQVLPTPSKLKDDTFLLDMAVDFAPPDRARMQRSGTPDSRRGGQRPYSPSVRAFTPLQSSYDDLAVLPSPWVTLAHQ